MQILSHLNRQTVSEYFNSRNVVVWTLRIMLLMEVLKPDLNRNKNAISSDTKI